MTSFDVSRDAHATDTTRDETRSASGTDRAGRGTFIVLVGPDGVGKTTVARAIGSLSPRTVRYFHFRPPLTTALILVAQLDTSFRPAPKATGVVGPVFGWVRLSVNFVRFWLGYAARVRPALTRGEIVVGDRWAYAYLVQPRAVRFGGPSSLARAFVALLPQPDLVVNLSASPDVIRARKAELSLEEIRRELDEWRRLPARRLHTVDATRNATDVAAEVSILIAASESES